MGLAVALLCVLVLSGCAPADSRLDEYRTTAQDIAARIVGLIPAELEPTSDAATQSRGVAPLNGVTSKTSPRDTARWEVRAFVRLADREGSAAAAIAAVTRALEDDGWASSRVRETGGGRTVTDGFRRDGWYVEIAWSRSEPGTAERFDIFVVSPDTVRGDHEELRS